MTAFNSKIIGASDSHRLRESGWKTVHEFNDHISQGKVYTRLILRHNQGLCERAARLIGGALSCLTLTPLRPYYSFKSIDTICRPCCGSDDFSTTMCIDPCRGHSKREFFRLDETKTELLVQKDRDQLGYDLHSQVDHKKYMTDHAEEVRTSSSCKYLILELPESK